MACWGFDRLFDEQPTWEECRHLTLFDAAVFHKCGDLSIAEGLWPVLRHMERFEPTEWPNPPTTFVHILGDSHPIEPRRQRVIITEDVERCCVSIRNEGYVSPDRYHWLPWGLGWRWRDMLSYAISNAVKKRHPAYYCRPTPEIVAVWNTCIERVKQAGLFPVAEPRR